MQKEGRKFIQTAVAEMARKMTATEANAACPLIFYQPKLPEKAKAMRKF